MVMQMKWKHLFPVRILNRGKSYFYSGQVYDLEKKEHTLTAKVDGYDTYYVTIQLNEDEQSILHADCSCPYAEDHSYCKHEAAVLFAYDDQLRTESKEKEYEKFQIQILPQIKKAFTKNDYFFDMGKVLNSLPIRYDTWQKGVQLVHDHAITIDEPKLTLSEWVDEDQTQYLVVQSYYKNRMSAYLELRHNEIKRLSCRDYECRNSYDTYYARTQPICEHEAALLYLTIQYILQNNPGDRTDRNGFVFLETFNTTKTTNIDHHVKLVPHLNVDIDSLSFSVWLGNQRLYKIRSFSSFVHNLHTQTPYVISKKTQFQLDKESFDPEYIPLLELIEAKVVERENTPVRYGYEPLHIGAEIDLSGQTIDAFYDIAQTIPVEYEKKHIQTKTTQLDISFTIKPLMQNQSTQGVQVTGHVPTIIKGIRYGYYFENNTLYRIPLGQADSFIHMPRNENDDITFQIGNKHLAHFYYDQLPKIQETSHVEIIEPETIESILPPEPDFTFYFDADDDYMICTIEAIYDKSRYRMTDEITNDAKGYYYDPSNKEHRYVEREMDMFQILQNFDFHYQDKHMLCIKDDDHVYKFLTEGIDTLLQYGTVEATTRFEHLQIITKPKITVGVSVDSDLMDIQITSDDLTQDELIEILSHYKEKKTYHRLSSGKFVQMDAQSLQSLEQMMESLHMTPKQLVSGKMNVPMYRAFYLDRMLAEKNDLRQRKDASFKNTIKKFKNEEFALPKKLHAELRPYQEEGYQWIKTLEAYHFGGILADEMGLGKTLQVITALAAHKEEQPSPSLVICPASLVYNWKAEMERFAPQLQTALVSGTKKERKTIIENYINYDVLVTSYDLLKRDIAEYEDTHFYFEIIDEAQYTKNHTTAAAKSVKLINSQCRLALTGTPIENQLQELWSIFDYLMPGFLYSYDYFRKNMEVPIVKQQDQQQLEQLRKMISPFILRRLKKDVLKDLPDKLEKVQYVSMDKKQTHVYNGQVTKLQQLLKKTNDEDFKKQRFKILSQLTRIRQVCCDPSLCLEDYDGTSAKREACMDLIENAIEGGHKILVFSQFTTMLDKLEKDCEAKQIAYYEITGATKKNVRIDRVNAFNKNDVPVFFISLKAGGTGLNLTGADIVIHYDPWWNTAAQNQATDRAHRIGQKNDVTVYKLIIKDTIEEKILELQEKKQALADDILSGEQMSNTTISKEDLEALLQ